MTQRENNLDLYRIICTLGIVLIHVSAIFISGYTKELNHPIFACICNSVPRFAVPGFVMLSGAFLLDNPKSADYKYFYKKAFNKIGIHIIIFTVIYILYRLPFALLGKDTAVLPLIEDILRGAPMYHMWYVYMLTGLYAVTPIIIRFKDSIKESTFVYVSVFYTLIALLSMYFQGYVGVNWNLGQVFEYVGYFMLGYCLKKNAKKSNLKGLLLTALALLFELGAAAFEYNSLLKGYTDYDFKIKIVSPCSPFIFIASVLMFYGFCRLNVKKSFSRLSGLTFYIFLIHAGVWDALQKIFFHLKGEFYLINIDSRYAIFVFTLSVFLISALLAFFYKKLWRPKK